MHLHLGQNKANISVYFFGGNKNKFVSYLDFLSNSVNVNSRNLVHFTQMIETEIFINNIELLNNNSHRLSPPGGLASPSGGFVSLLFDQGLHFASIKLCQASWM